jgi:predicted phosphoribosyltransferase
MAKDKAKLLLIIAIPVTSHLNDVVDSSNKMAYNVMILYTLQPFYSVGHILYLLCKTSTHVVLNERK